ncbi:hypothetical protein FACS1894219_02610 [Clostridia bacterium]|nr:hypothetical protein FACS1894219_02610 [Clostridia bacterium]
MKIATWNIERLKHKFQLESIKRECDRVRADILVLTETDSQVKPDYKYYFQTSPLTDYESVYYKSTERRISIFTNYECINRYPTYDEQTALCVELETTNGRLLVYGTIIGILGNKHPSFMEDVTKQLDDIEQFAAANHNLCVCGDFNCTFADNYYFTKASRNAIIESFSKNKLALLTKHCGECIDHIAISEKLAVGATIQIDEWNEDKTLSDHKGIWVALNKTRFESC